MTTEEILAAQARAEAATSGSEDCDGTWEIEREECEEDFDEVPPIGFPRRIGPISFWEHDLPSYTPEQVAQVEADAALISNARADVRRLAADLLAANARRAALERLYRALVASSYVAADAGAEGAALDALTSALTSARALGLDV